MGEKNCAPQHVVGTRVTIFKFYLRAGGDGDGRDMDGGGALICRSGIRGADGLIPDSISPRGGADIVMGAGWVCSVTAPRI